MRACMHACVCVCAHACVCVCVCSWLKPTTDLILNSGCCLTESLNSCQGWSTAEALHTSQGEPSVGAHTVSLRRFSVWYMATWNVRTLLDVDGFIETARQGCDVSVSDERKMLIDVTFLNQ